MIRVEGLKHHNGSPFGYDGFAALSLRSLDRPGSVALGSAQPAEFETAIVPGRYAFEYRLAAGRQRSRTTATARCGNWIYSGSVGTTCVLNVPSVMQPFQFRHNGVAFPAAEFERGDFVLRRGATRRSDGGFLARGGHRDRGDPRVCPRRALAACRRRPTSPRNADVPVVRGLRMNGALRVIDVPSIEVSGTFLVNGQPTPITEFENAQLRLVGKNRGDTLVLGQTRYGGFLKHVVPGLVRHRLRARRRRVAAGQSAGDARPRVAGRTHAAAHHRHSGSDIHGRLPLEWRGLPAQRVQQRPDLRRPFPAADSDPALLGADPVWRFRSAAATGILSRRVRAPGRGQACRRMPSPYSVRRAG